MTIVRSRGVTAFSFAEVVSILMELFKIDLSKKATFVGRLQQLQKAGIPERSNVGRGSRVQYEASQILALVLCLDLLDCGLPPATLSRYFGENSAQNPDGLFSDRGHDWRQSLISARGRGADLYFLFRPNALAYLQTTSSHQTREQMSGLLIEGSEIALDQMAKKSSIVLNVTRRFGALRLIVERLFPSRTLELV